MSQSTSNVVKAIGTAKTEVSIPDPDFITYLLDPEQEYNCYFVVGNPKLGKPERIGVVKKMLLAHSLILRAELQESKIAEKNDVKVTDIFPHTFKHFLRFVYGFDNTEGLTFEEADNLLYAAEKYMVPKLKNRLATRLMSMLDCSNICSLMNNPACYTVLELNSAITEILQGETDQVLASPQFLDLSPSGFLKIVEQEMSNVPEIELWRSAIQWAKNRGGSENAVVLRNELKDHLKHIRVCSMSDEDLMVEVVPTGVLKYGELKLIGKSHKTREVQPELTSICNLIEERESPKSGLLNQSFGQEYQYQHGYGNRITESTFMIKTKNSAVELCSAQLYYTSLNPHQCKCTVSIQRGTEPPAVVRFEGQVGSASGWDIPIKVNQRNVLLSANSEYSIKFKFNCSNTHYGRYNVANFVGNHFSVDFCSNSNGYYIFHVNNISYKTLKRVKPVQTER